MDVSRLKEQIIRDNKIPDILESIGCRNVLFHSGSPDDYYTCSNKDGDNPSAITIYCNRGVKCINYTRELNAKKSDHDIFDLVMFNDNISFFQALKKVCDIVGYDYYKIENEADVPESLKLTMLIDSLITSSQDEYVDDGKVAVIPENVLNYYDKAVNNMFAEDGISYATQILFEIGYDDETNHITIPIRDELSNLIGVKGRKFEKCPADKKYSYLIRCPRGKVLYNLFRAFPYVKEENNVIVVESEKACMQLYDMGIKNVVALSGSKLTSVQRQKILSLHTDVTFCLDKDIPLERIEHMANQFPVGVTIYAVIDKEGILDEKESPSDNPSKFAELYSKRVQIW